MAKFLLLLNHAPGRYDGMSQDQMMDVVKDYIAWVEEHAATGRYLGGEKLGTDPGRTLSRSESGIDVHDSPFAELPEVLGGYMVIEAADYDEAVSLARSHPHLVYNKTLHVRLIDEVG